MDTGYAFIDAYRIEYGTVPVTAPQNQKRNNNILLKVSTTTNKFPKGEMSTSIFIVDFLSLDPCDFTCH